MSFFLSLISAFSLCLLCAATVSLTTSLAPAHSSSLPLVFLPFSFPQQQPYQNISCVCVIDKERERNKESPSTLFRLRGLRNFQWLSLSAVMDKACSGIKSGGSAQDSSPSYPLFSHSICFSLLQKFSTASTLFILSPTSTFKSAVDSLVFSVRLQARDSRCTIVPLWL